MLGRNGMMIGSRKKKGDVVFVSSAYLPTGPGCNHNSVTCWVKQLNLSAFLSSRVGTGILGEWLMLNEEGSLLCVEMQHKCVGIGFPAK